MVRRLKESAAEAGQSRSLAQSPEVSLAVSSKQSPAANGGGNAGGDDADGDGDVPMDES